MRLQNCWFAPLDRASAVAICYRRPHAPALNRRRRRKSMFIQTEATPNPATLKFIPGRAVLDSGTMEFVNREAAARSPLAERLFGVPGVTSVFYGSDFVTVTKDDSDWQHLKPAILGAIMEHYMSGAPLLADGSAGNDEALDEGDEFFNEADAETVATIKDLIETRVRPAVAIDGDAAARHPEPAQAFRARRGRSPADVAGVVGRARRQARLWPPCLIRKA